MNEDVRLLAHPTTARKNNIVWRPIFSYKM